ncbi:hypothetical protein TIFTF001_021307 [Ficus carica]|uniref:Uncharacterized protein n=1 Tax=Ficus carica TaxID=3494 RepID=A0AA88AGG4_FICCA|nr:hypothetical protein TIFTF001_021307 [Ficus carica]
MGTESQELSKEKLKSCELWQSKEAIVSCRADFAFLCAICIAELRNARDSP